MSTDQCRSRPLNKGRRGWGGGGGGSSRPGDKRGAWSPKKRFVALQASVWNKNQWGGTSWAPPLDSPLQMVYPTDVSDIILPYNLQCLTLRLVH